MYTLVLNQPKDVTNSRLDTYSTNNNVSHQAAGTVRTENEELNGGLQAIWGTEQRTEWRNDGNEAQVYKRHGGSCSNSDTRRLRRVIFSTPRK